MYSDKLKEDKNFRRFLALVNKIDTIHAQEERISDLQAQISAKNKECEGHRDQINKLRESETKFADYEKRISMLKTENDI